MEHYRSLEGFFVERSWLTVGTFDGVHRGHQRVIQRLVEGARAAGTTSVALTFDPHPAALFGRSDIKLLTLPDERAELLGGLGVDVVITHPFNRDVAEMTAFDFMQRLHSHFRLERFILGYDSTLGKDREGDIPRLTEIGTELGYTVEVTPVLSDENGVISSTKIRTLIAAGEMAQAARLLTRPYQLQGVVIRGDQRGRTIGFPTANLGYSAEKLIPAAGIYACWAYCGSQRYKAAVNIGINPTFTPDRSSLSVEAYLLDFDRDIYDETLRLEFIVRLRDELKYNSAEALTAQIQNDVERTREALGTI